MSFPFSVDGVNVFWGIVVTYEICVFFEGAQKEVFSSILKYVEQAELKLCPNLWPFRADISSVTYDEQNAKQVELNLCPNPS
jgi:hypothetical protein